MRFPALLDNIAPFLSPIEAAYEELRGTPAVFVVACPSQYTALARKDKPPEASIMTPSNLMHTVTPLLSASANAQAQRDAFPAPSAFPGNETDQVLQVSGLRNVLNILEKVENGVLNDVPVLELFVCDQGCFGSPLFKEGPFIARYRWSHAFLQYNPAAQAIRRPQPLLPREGLRLASDMTEAIRKLSAIDQLRRTLPGKNCGMCGSPTCNALAEDIVMGRATNDMCVYWRKS